MVLPLVVLAIASASVGAYFALSGSFAELLARTPSLAYEPMHVAVEEHGGGSHLKIAVISTVIALSGIGLAAYLYLGDRKQADGLARVLRPLYVLSYGKLFFDPIYQVLFVWPLWLLAQVSYWFDRTFIDGIVNLVGRVPPWVATGLRSLQTGMAQFYALAMVWGVLVLVLTLLVWPALGALWK
jgi:NADH-quinone oxidoreductase subunit L